MARGKGVRSDIPYKDRLLLEKYRTIKEHRDDAARVALKVACVALNNTEGLGYTRLIRFADELERLLDEYYSDPEVQEEHLNERLNQIGFCCEGPHMYGATDQNGKAVKMEKVGGYGS
jgi:hypothetical protein